MGPQSLGRAGAVVMEDDSPEALHWNPASLTQRGLQLQVFGASGTGSLATLGSLGLTGAMGDFGRFGLAYASSRYSSVDQAESAITVGAALPLGKSMSLGFNQRFLQSEPGGMRGWGMDVGLVGKLTMPTWLGQSLNIGLSATDLASSLAWANGLEEVQPMVMRLGGSLQPLRSLKVAYQQDWIDRSGGGTVAQWRAGADLSFLDQRLVIRGGATRAQGSLLYATAGLGLGIDAGGARWQIDYAYLASPEAGSSLGAATRHLVSLSTHFGRRPPREPEAHLAKVLKDPRTGKVHQAKFSLSGEEGIEIQDWEFAVKDKKGRTVRSFKGKGALPPSLSWDGKDGAGKLVDGDGLAYDLRTTSTSGKKSLKKSLLGASLASLGAGADLAELGGADYGLRDEGAKASGSKLRVKPSLKGSKDFALSGADFDLSAAAPASSKEWELRIVDSEGKTVKKFAGKGRPPKNLHWEGTDELGSPVVADLGSGYVLRVVDEKGKESHQSDDLVGAENFGAATEIARRQSPERAPEPRKKAEREEKSDLAEGQACRWDATTRAWICVIPFAAGSRLLSDEGADAAREAARLLGKRRFRSLEVAGHAGEAAESVQGPLSKARAEMVLKKVLALASRRPKVAVATGLGGGLPVTPGRAEEGLVEVFIKD